MLFIVSYGSIKMPREWIYYEKDGGYVADENRTLIIIELRLFSGFEENDLGAIE